MPTMTNITLADANATPVNHVFTPTGPDANGLFWMVDASQASPIGYWKISLQYVEPPQANPGESSKTRVYRVRVGLHEPVLENVTNSTVTGILPAPTLSYIPRAFVEYVLPERATLLERSNMTKMLPLLLQNAQIIDMVNNLNRPR